MNRKLKYIQTMFIASIVGLVGVSVISLGAVLYATNAIEVRHNVSSSQLHDIVKDYPAVEAYVQNQKHAEPHFVTIANLVKIDQQKLLAKALLLTGIPILLVSIGLAYALARKLVKPVEQTFFAQERFLQDASHEMRNPLAALYAVVQDGRSSNSLAEKDRALASIDRQARQLVKLNEDLLLLERSKRDHNKNVKNNLSELTLDVVDSLVPYAVQQKITVKTRVAADVVASIVDEDWVCVVRNVVENAIKYSNPSSVVMLKLSRIKNAIVLEVTDKGIGISKSEIEHLGERFFRGSNVGRISGTGLGMAIVYQIIHNYHGTVAIVSKQNKGTKITVRVIL